MTAFFQKCISDLRRPWEIAFVVLAVAAIVLLYDNAVSAILLQGRDARLNAWLKLYGDLWQQAHLLFFFAVILGARGIGQEIADRTVRLWMLTPHSRVAFILTSQFAGICAVTMLWLLLMVFMACARFLIGPPPTHFRSSFPLAAKILLVALVLHAVSRLLAFFSKSARTAIAGTMGGAIGLEVLVHMLPERVSQLLPQLEHLVEPGLVVAKTDLPYPVIQAVEGAFILLAAIAIELSAFRNRDVKV